MNALPIVDRELMVRARQARTQWGRVFVAAIAGSATLLSFVVWGGGSVDVAQQAGLAFQALAWMGFLTTCVGFLFTVDCLSSERRAGTLGLLMATRVGRIGVLFGKLTANGVAATFGLAALVPVLMVPVLAGGVAWVEAVRTVAACFSMFSFTLCLGLYASSESKRLGEALARVIVWFGFVMIATLMAGICPLGAFLDADPTKASPIGGGFWPGLFAGPLLGLLFLGLAGNSMKKSWKEHADRRELRPPVALDPTREPRPVGDADPIVWLLRKDGSRVAVLWMAAGLQLLSLLLGAGIARSGGLALMGGVSAAAVVVGAGSAVLFAYAGARFMMYLRKSGAFELLHATSMGVGRLAATQWSVLRGELLVPLLLLVSLTLVLRVGSLNASLGPGLPGGIISLILLMTVPIQIVVNTLALCALGMWFGLRSRSSFTAILWSVGLVVGLDLAITGGFLGLYALYGASTRTGAVPVQWMVLVGEFLVPLVAILKQVWLIQWASRHLRKRLSGDEIQPFDLNRRSRGALATIQKWRQWTPSGGGS